MFSRAIVRTPSAEFARGLTTVALGAPDPVKMFAQHAAYCAALERLGVELFRLPPLQGYPDAHYVEDTAVMLAELAVVTRPGAPERRGEEQAMASELKRHRATVQLEPPGTLDGGDVLVVGRDVLIGLSHRTDAAGAAQLARIVAAHGYRSATVPVAEGLHLKSSATWAGGRTLLVTEALARRPELRPFDLVTVAAQDEYSANVLLVNGTLLIPAGFPRTRDRLGALGLPLLELDMSECRKLDGGLTCLSLRF